jgi:hypothetical protein
MTNPIISLQADTIYAGQAAGDDQPARQQTTKTAINEVLASYLAQRRLDLAAARLIDSFFYIIKIEAFAHWEAVDWWDQRQILRGLKTDSAYGDRAGAMLDRSIYREYYTVPDVKVGYYEDPRVSYGWMRKRLLLEESYWNIIDSVAYGAYHKKKYRRQYPGIGVLLLQHRAHLEEPEEILLIADNGAGRDFRKTSKDSGAFRVLYKFWKLIHRRGLYLLGGLNLGLQETCGELYCFGTGAVTTQCSLAAYTKMRQQ